MQRLEWKCLLHVDDTYDFNQKIIPFTEESLQNCHEKKSIRDEQKKKASKFDKINLPEIADGIVGYHSLCYRCYCSVKKPVKPVEALCNII